ncbi:MAG: DUF5667 domain-containing protein [Tepidiformaceae bacterium]
MALRALFAGKPAPAAQAYAEAQALLDDGFGRDFVLALYADEAEWLAPLLEAAETVAEGFAAEQPSYYFEASLKNRLLGAMRESHAPAAARPVEATAGAAGGSGAMARVRTAFAGAGVMAAIALVGVVTLGFVTADQAVPGDWNYRFKLANERLDYALSRGDERIDVQIKQAQARVYEIQKLSARGDLSQDDLANLQSEARNLAEQARGRDIDDVTKAEIRGLDALTTAVLDTAGTRQPDLAPAVVTTKKAVSDAVAASLSGTVVAEPPSPTATPSPVATPTREATATPESRAGEAEASATP